MKNKILLFITINIFICCSSLFSQHWEFIPTLKDYKKYDSTAYNIDYNFTITPFKIVNDTLICTSYGYFNFYVNNDWKFITNKDMIKSNIKDTALANYLINNNPEFWKTDYIDNKFIFKIVSTTKEYSYSKYKITIFYDIDKQYKSIDKIYDSDSGKYFDINTIISVNTDNNTTPYFLIQTYNDERPKNLAEVKVRLCKIEADTLKTIYIFENQNLYWDKNVQYIIKFDKKNNYWLTSNDTLYYFQNDIPTKKFCTENDFKSFVESKIYIREIFINSDNNITFVDFYGGIFSYNHSTNFWSVDKYLSDYQLSVAGYGLGNGGYISSGQTTMDTKGNIYITLFHSNFLFKKHTSGKWEQIYIEPQYLISYIMADDKDRVFVFFSGGLYEPSKISASNGVALSIYYPED